MTPDSTTATPCDSGPPSGSSNRFANTGSPTAPKPIEAIVIPTWQAAMYSSIESISRLKSAAPLSPRSTAASTRSGRTRTSEYSAATKNAFIAISAKTARINTTVIPRTPTGQRRVAGYFEVGLDRRAFAGTQRNLASRPGDSSAFLRLAQLWNHPAAHVDGRPLGSAAQASCDMTRSATGSAAATSAAAPQHGC